MWRHRCSGRRRCAVGPGCWLCPWAAASHFCCLLRRWCSGRRPAPLMVLLVAPRVLRAPEGPAAREARASLRSAPRLEARPCPPVPPAPSTPVEPGVLMIGSARRLVVRPGPATAHGHRSQAPRCLRSPPHRRRLRCRRVARRVVTAQVSRPDLTCRIAETVPNFARNSPATISNIEFVSLELQRFVALLNVHPIELRAKLRCGVSLLWLSLLLRGIALLG